MLYPLARSFIFKLQPESAHKKILTLGKQVQKSPLITKTLTGTYQYENSRLRTHFLGHEYPHPIGLAAGFDKNGEIIPFLSCLGFSFIEIGSVTAEPWAGNPAPRIWRFVKDQAIMNRMGLNNHGVDEVLKNLPECSIPLGINIAKTPDFKKGTKALDDFKYTFEKVGKVADYITINISCPNTEEGKTFEEPSVLAELLSSLPISKAPPVLVKLSPDAYDLKETTLLKEVIQICAQAKISGLVISNTTANKNHLPTATKKAIALGRGGISGRPLNHISTELIKVVARITEGSLPIIGVGGVFNAEDAYSKIRAGAHLVQIYSSLIYHGPGTVKDIKQGLIQLLDRDKFEQISEVIGKDL